jgi:hypothetical protein
VGDPHQQIYSFMGAVDAMQRVRKQLEGQPGNLLVLRSLRRSFRFGPQIASVGNAILRVKQERRSVLGMRAHAHRYLSPVVHAAGALRCQLRRRDSKQQGNTTVRHRDSAASGGGRSASVCCLTRLLGVKQRPVSHWACFERAHCCV